MSHHTELGRNEAGRTSTANNFQLDLKIFIKDVHDRNGRKRPLTVKPWATVKDVKDMLCKHLHVQPSAQAIYYGPLLTSARELPNYRTLQDAGIYKSGETLLLEIKGANSNLASSSQSHSISSLRSPKASDICVSSSLLDLTPKSLQRLVQQARRGLAIGLKPILAPDGSGGSYFLSDARKLRVGVFKPADEEPMAENNPRGYVPQGDGDSLRQGIRPGELCLREVAAFILDHDGFSGVPMTTLAEAQHPSLHVNGKNWSLLEGGAAVGIHSLNSPSSGSDLVKKVGSFQEYVHAECSMDDLGPSKIKVDEVHKIAILDIRLMNADRNVANILCQRIHEDPENFRLVPIDHGYSLRSVADVAWFDWCWLDWPQTKQPLSQKSKNYVLNLDIEADVRLLQERLNMGNDVIDYFRASCYVLKAGVRAGLTLYDIASEILCRSDPCGEAPSKLETLTTMAKELSMSAVHNGRFHHATASLALEEQLASTSSGMPPQISYSSKFSIPFNSSVKPKPVVRSASSFFSVVPSLGGESAFSDELFGSSNSNINENETQPAMVTSSNSDCSSDGDLSSTGVEEVEAEEWAAALVAVTDVSMDQDGALFGSRNRSSSDSSDTSSGNSDDKLSKSPVGFWRVRPGSSPDESEDDDDEPISWTPSLTPSNPPAELFLQESMGPPHILAPNGFSVSNLSKLLKNSSVNDAVGQFQLDDMPDSVADNHACNDNNNTNHTIDDQIGNLSFRPLQNQKMVRSMSYTAFSTYSDSSRRSSQGLLSNANSSTIHNNLNNVHNFKSAAVRNTRNSISSSKEEELFRTYFLKFVDLLVVRETERLVHFRAR